MFRTWIGIFQGVNMYFFVIMIYLSTATANKTFCSTCINVDNLCHNISYLLDLPAPFRDQVVIHEMGILKHQNTLFYSFEPNITDDEYYKVGFVSLDDPTKSGVLSGGNKLIINFGTFDIDQDNKQVYLGGSDGIFVLDTQTNTVSPYSTHGDTVIKVFYKGLVYFVRYGEYKVVQKKGNEFANVFEAMPVKNFVINKNYEMVFLSIHGLFVKRGDDIVKLAINPFFRGLTIDLKDTVYAWWIDGIYRVDIEMDLKDSKIVKIAHIPTVGAITFDNDNHILFTTDRSLYRLTPTTNTTAC